MCIISRRSGVFVAKFELKQQIFLVGKYLLKVKWIITCSKSTKKTLDKLSLKALVPLLLTSNRYLSTRYLLVSQIFTIQRTVGKTGGYLFDSSLPFPPASQTLRHQLGNYCKELIFAHSWQPDSN